MKTYKQKVPLLFLLIFIAYLLFTFFSKDNYIVPRTAFGDPDLQGVWSNASLTALRRPRITNKLVISESDAFKYSQYLKTVAKKDNSELPKSYVLSYHPVWFDFGSQLLKVNNEYRTSIIIDPTNGLLPYIPDVNETLYQREKKILNQGIGHPEDGLLGERCLTGYGSTVGPPMLNVLYNNYYKFLQTPDYVVILVEMVHDVRIIPLKHKRSHSNLKPWFGESIGHWDGDTLVVKTKNINPRQRFSHNQTMALIISENAIVTEYFTRISDNKIHYKFTVEDSSVYTKKWTGELVFNTVKGNILEYACHEGNRDIELLLKLNKKEEEQENEN